MPALTADSVPRCGTGRQPSFLLADMAGFTYTPAIMLHRTANSTVRRTRCLVAVALVLVTFVSHGCVRRRLTIRSNPPGAVVYVDEQRIGTTPVSTEFTYYGTRKVRLVKDGYETLSTLQTVRPPWYEIPPLDFVSENIVGRELRDERIWDFQLQPQQLVPTAELLTRANNLRVSAAKMWSRRCPCRGLEGLRMPTASDPSTACRGTYCGSRLARILLKVSAWASHSKATRNE